MKFFGGGGHKNWHNCKEGIFGSLQPFESLAPQVGLEPTTLRLTARSLHQNTSPWRITKRPHTLRYVAQC
jgi:hypothetical protein